MKITDVVVRNLPSPPVGVKIYLADDPTGFGVRVTANGIKAFVLTYGKQRERVTIGRYPIVSLAEARAEAKRILAERTLGKHRPKRMSFEDAFVVFLDTRKKKNRPKSVYETERTVKLYLKKLYPMQLDDIRAHHITDITDALSKKGLQSTASHVHTTAHTFLRFCAQRSYLTFNPVADMEKPTLPKPRERVLDDQELVAVWKAADELGGRFGAICKILILTGCRRSEAQHIRVDGISAIIDAAHSKNGRTHQFPIGQLTQQLLKENPDLSWGGWGKSKAALDGKVQKILGRECPHVIHDYRRSFCTNLQRLGVLPPTIDALVNHVSGQTQLTRTYQRHAYWDEMVHAVGEYDRWIRTLV